MRRRIYDILERARPGDKLSHAYDWMIVSVALISVFPLMFRRPPDYLTNLVETICVYLLFSDYILRFITADYASKHPAKKAFFLYPFTPFAIASLLGILPSLNLLPASFRVLRLLLLSVVLHYSKSFKRIVKVFHNQRRTLLSVLVVAIGYIFLSALVMFISEPEHNFPQFYDAIYWATTALTTVGYGDIYPTTVIGKFISMLSSIFGVAVIAMPAGIVTAGFLDTLNEDLKHENDPIKPAPVAKMAKPLFIYYLKIMSIGFLLNLVLYYLAHHFALPAWLDSLGTIYAAIMLEPTAGLLLAFLTIFIQTVFVYGPGAMVYYLIAAIAALSFGLLLRNNQKELSFKALPKALLLFFVLGTIFAALLTLWETGGVPKSGWEHHFYNLARERGFSNTLSCFLGTGVLKLIDTLVIALVIPLLVMFSHKISFLKRPK